MPRKFDSEIVVTSDDRWIFRGNEIVQEDILSYFRSNLKQDESGVFIDNRFGELEEHGYLTLYGYPVHVTYVSEEGGTLFFTTDASKTLGLDDVQIVLKEDGQLILYEKGYEKIQYRFTRTAAGQLANWIQEAPDSSEEKFILVYNNKVYPL